MTSRRRGCTFVPSIGVPSSTSREAIRADNRPDARGVSEDGVTTPFECEVDEDAVDAMAVCERRFGLGVIVFVDFIDPENEVLSCVVADRTTTKAAAVGAGFERSKL